MKTILPVFCAVVWLLVPSGFAQEQGRNIRLASENTPTSSKRLALVIGNAAYTHAKSLANPANDASDMVETLRTLGFDVLSGTNLNKQQMENSIRQFGMRLAQTKGTGLFYYAGHGLQVNGENYLVPVDADIPEQDEVQYQAVPMNMVLSKMDSAGNDLNIVILDACRNNPFARSWRGFRDAGETDGLARVSPPQGTIVLYATRPGNVASDGTGRNGLFTESLLRQIKRPNIELDQVIKNLTREVSEKSNRKQFPWREGSSVGDFYFAGSDKSSVIINSPAVPGTSVAVTYYNNGVAYFQRGEYDNAVAEFTKAIKLDSKYEPAYHYRGLAISYKNEYIPAIIDFTKSIELNPKNVYSYIYRGNMYSALNGYDKAISDYSKAIELNPKDTYAYNSRGVAYVNRREYELAEADFGQAIRINSGYAPAWRSRGWLHNIKGEYDLAIADFTKSIEIESLDPLAYDSRGWSYLNKKNFDRAITDFNKAIELSPQYPKAYLNRGVTFANQQKFDLAIADYTKVIELTPKDALAYRNRSIAYDAIGRKDLAAADRKRAEELEKQ